MSDLISKPLASTLVLKAESFATKAHFHQKRKYTGQPYIIHPRNVANIVSKFEHNDNIICAAWLHDTVEDTNVKLNDIKNIFGDKIAELVDDLTKVSTFKDGNRKARKEKDLIHISKALPAAKTIKLADIIDNVSTIKDFDPDFAKIYIPEKIEMLKVLKEGNLELFNITDKLLKKLNIWI